jgi:O-antigen/teichoic acid export membrane protein
MPQLLFAAFYGAEVAGWFALGQRVIAAPLNIVVDSVAQVYFGEAARLSRSDPKAMRRLFFKLTARLALVGGLPVVMVCAMAPWFFPFVFGKGWETAGRYAQILGPMFAVRLAVVPISQTLNILEKQHWFFAWQATRMGLGIGALLAAKAVGVSHIAAVALYSLAMMTAYILLLIISWHALVNRSEKGDISC